MLGQQKIRPLGNGKFQTSAGVFDTYAEAMASLAKPMSPALSQPSYGDKMSTMADPNAMAKSQAAIQSSPAMPMPSGGLLNQSPAPAPAPAPQTGATQAEPSFMDRLTSAEGLGGIGSMMLAMSNNPSLQRLGAAGMTQFGEAAKAKKMQNRTVQALRQAKRDDLADAVESGLLDVKSAAAMLYAKQDPKVVGKSLVVPDGKGGVKVLYSEGDSDDATTAFKTLQARAQAAGLKEGTPEYTQFMIDGGTKSGFAIRTTPDGGFEFVQGGASATNKPLTEGQATSTMYYGRMVENNKILDGLGLDVEGTDFYNRMVNNIPFAAKYLTSPEYRRYDYAKLNWIAALLRKESGAVIGTDEYYDADQQYFPQPNDTPDIIEDKRKRRASALAGMRTSAGSGASKSDSSNNAPLGIRQ